MKKVIFEIFKQYMNSKYKHTILQLWVEIIKKMLKWEVAGQYEGKEGKSVWPP